METTVQLGAASKATVVVDENEAFEAYGRDDKEALLSLVGKLVDAVAKTKVMLAEVQAEVDALKASHANTASRTVTTAPFCVPPAPRTQHALYCVMVKEAEKSAVMHPVEYNYVPREWWHEWLAYVQSNDPTRSAPGHICTLKLVSGEVSTCGRALTKPTVTFGTDYISVPNAFWINLVYWYGLQGPAITRTYNVATGTMCAVSIPISAVTYERISTSTAPELPAEYRPVFAPLTDVVFFRQVTIGELKRHVAKVMKIDTQTDHTCQFRVWDAYRRHAPMLLSDDNTTLHGALIGSGNMLVVEMAHPEKKTFEFDMQALGLLLTRQ